MCGMCGLNTVGSWDKPMITWPDGVAAMAANDWLARPSGSRVPAAPMMAMARAWRRVGFNRLLPLSESSRRDMLKLP
jgi:hypothetical protein